MLRTRILVSTVLVPAFVGLCWLDAQTGPRAAILMPLALLLAIQAGREAAALQRLTWPSTIAAIAGSAAVIGALWGWHLRFPDNPSRLEPLGAAFLAGACALLGLLGLRLCAFRGPAGHNGIVAAETFAVSYIGMLLATAAELRWQGGGRLGYLALGSLVIGAKVGDIGGYSFGRLFGKTKLAPILSPGKTRAGAVGAVATASVATAAWLHFIGPLFVGDAHLAGWPQLLAFGALLGVVGLIGDLAESLLKRDAGTKDASHLMPAFGGLLDLIDSILYSAPAALLVWIVWPPVW